MTNLTRYTAADLPALMEKINKYSIGMDEYFDRLFHLHETTSKAQRSFTRAWTLSDDTEVRSVDFEDGLLTVTLGRIVPDHHKRKDYL